MKIDTLILPIIVVLLLFETGSAQTKHEVAEWLNGDGEEYLKAVTGNSSLYWKVENNGALKITNNKASHMGTKVVIRAYTYLNMYELDPKEPVITGDKSSKELILRCEPGASNCIRTRYYYTNTNFKTDASSFLRFSLEEKFDEKKGRNWKRNCFA